MVLPAMAALNLPLALRLLVALADRPQSSYELADALRVGRATVVRLVAQLRALGCVIEAVPCGQRDWAYFVTGWGLFVPGKVRAWVAVNYATPHPGAPDSIAPNRP